MDERLVVSPHLAIPPDELSWRFSRSGGAGGQHVNTSDTRVALSYDVARAPSIGPTLRARALERLADRLVDGVVTVVASERRSQLQNRQLARERLAEVLRVATAPPPRRRRPTKPTRTAVERRLADKRRRADLKRLRRDSDDR